MESDVEKISSDIVAAVKLIMDPITPAVDRRRAHEMLDNFKDTSPLGAKCGFYLASKKNSAIIRHCGFQLIDNYIKLHWNVIDLNQKLWIKNTIIETIASGTEPMLKEEMFVKDAISRIVVELIKREWPQHWSSLMEELHILCVMGDEQTELVLLIFSRLADDIVQFQNVPDTRRREIYKSLCSCLNELFAFFWDTLSKKAELHIVGNKNAGIASDRHLRTCRIIQVTLETLSTFVDWVPISYILEIPLLKLLSKLLELENLRMSAAMCLLSILDRKGKPEERKHLLTFFKETVLFKEISGLDEATLQSEQHYLFLRELAKCFLSLGTILCSSLALNPCPVTIPQNFPLYLNCVLVFTKHPSLVLSHNAQILWLNILRSPQLSSSSFVHDLIPTLLKCETERILKVGYPSKTNSTSCKFSIIEFDSDDDFEKYFNKYRADIGDVLRQIMNIQPQVTFSFCKVLLSLLADGNDWKGILESSSSEMDQNLCWDAMATYIESICSTLVKKDLVNSREFAEDGFAMITMCKNLTSKDPVMLSYSLSCISSLFFFYSFSPENCSEVLDKIFSYFTAFPKDGPFVKEVMNLRRHASSLLIKLSCNYPALLLPMFDKICETIQTLFLSEECLTQFDKCALLEALMILSNKFCEYEKQSEFLKVVLESVIHTWVSPAVISGIESSEAFISFVGIDKPEQMSSSDFAFSKDASDLMYAVNIVRACVKRCACPTDPEVAKKGNFIHPLSESLGTVFYRNPASQFILPILEKVILLLRTLNGLHDPLVKQRIDPSFLTVVGINESEKNLILGISCPDNSQQPKTQCDRIKIYVQNLYEGCLFILWNAVENLGIDFYTLPNLPTLLTDSILFKIEYMPAFNLKSIIRLFVRPFFLWCPSTAYNELMIVLEGLCPFMLQKLSAIWEKFKLRYGTSSSYEDQQTEAEEILEDQLNRLLTREYIQFLVDLLHKQNTKSVNGDNMDDGQPEVSTNHSKSLTELGLKIIGAESVRAVYICTAFDSLRWLDTTSNIRSLQLCELLFHKITEDGLVQNIVEANYLLRSVLYGVQELGEHEANLYSMLSFCITVYENLRQRFPDIRKTLMNSVACDESSIQQLDKVLKQNAQKTKNDKYKKEAFKNVIRNIIGRNVGQQHKRQVLIKNLPPLISFKPKENSSLFDVEINDNIGICKLFSPNEVNY